jgi:hypothetical protein
LLTLSLVIAVGLTYLLTACGDTEEPAPSVPTAVSLSASDLPSLVLDVDQVSVDGTILPLDLEDTGPQSKSDFTDGFDSAWWTETLEKYNWQAAYYQDFGTGDQDSPVFNASVQLDLYDTPENAAGALTDRFDHVGTLEGQTHDGATMESIEFFEVNEVNARGMRLTWQLSNGVSYTMTNIDFVRGSILVDVGTASTDERDLVPATLELVRLASAELIAAGV